MCYYAIKQCPECCDRDWVTPQRINKCGQNCECQPEAVGRIWVPCSECLHMQWEAAKTNLARLIEADRKKKREQAAKEKEARKAAKKEKKATEELKKQEEEKKGEELEDLNVDREMDDLGFLQRDEVMFK